MNWLPFPKFAAIEDEISVVGIIDRLACYYCFANLAALTALRAASAFNLRTNSFFFLTIAFYFLCCKIAFIFVYLIELSALVLLSVYYANNLAFSWYFLLRIATLSSSGVELSFDVLYYT